MNFELTRDRFEESGELILRLEITGHNYHDFPGDYKIIIECKTLEGLIKNLDYYTRKWVNELGKKNRIKKNRKHKQVQASSTEL